MASNKDPYSCNASWWDADVNRTDMSSTMGNVCLAIFEDLPSASQSTLLSKPTESHKVQLAREAAKNNKGK